MFMLFVKTVKVYNTIEFSSVFFFNLKKDPKRCLVLGMKLKINNQDGKRFYVNLRDGI